MTHAVLLMSQHHTLQTLSLSPGLGLSKLSCRCALMQWVGTAFAVRERLSHSHDGLARAKCLPEHVCAACTYSEIHGEIHCAAIL